jgi:hypothetical protein
MMFVLWSNTIQTKIFEEIVREMPLIGECGILMGVDLDPGLKAEFKHASISVVIG